MNLFKFEDTIINQDTFYNALRPYIKEGDLIYVEIDLMSFGDIYDVKINRYDFLNEFYNLLKRLVGIEGHIAFPSFSYSWGDTCKEKIFDIDETPGNVGLFPEYIRKNKKNFRTKDPMFSVIINGLESEEFSKIKNNSFGEGSFFHKAHKKNAKLVSFGLNKYDPTFVHYCEQYFDEKIKKIKYRINKKFQGYFIENNKKNYHSHYAFMRDMKLNFKFSDTKLKKDLIKTDKLQIINIGRGKIYISDCESVFNTCIDNMKEDTFYLVNKK